MNLLARLAQTSSGLALLAYPLLLLWGLRHLEPAAIALLLAALWLLRRLLTEGRSPFDNALAFAGIAVATLGFAANSEVILRLYPVAVNAVFLALFAFSLRFPPTVVERIARRQDPQLSAAGVRYAVRVTQVWCAFFVVNGGIAIFTAFASSREVWAWYNGFIAYLLIGAMFFGEWRLRRRFITRERQSGS